MRIKTTTNRRKTAVRFIMSAPELARMPGLFRNICAAEQAKYQVALRITYPHGDKVVKVIGGYLLSGFDLAVLQGLELIACGGGELIDESTSTHVELREKLQARSTDEAKDPLAAELSYATCSISALLRLVGMPVNDTYVSQVNDSLDRLFAVTISIADAAKPRSSEMFHLLSYVLTGESKRTSALHVALNPLVTAALTGSSNRQDIRLSAAELKALGTAHAARILHQRLCTLINDGCSRTFTASKLYSYLYPADSAAATLDTLRGRTESAEYQATRRQQAMLGEALEYLETKLVGWRMQTLRGAAEDSVEITRPKENWTYQDLHASASAPAQQEAAV